ncbi:Uu.00g115890.m01.CDS01 [Anthostomella pinea]|uniref:Uu.00g115890.m01.CDS01 n=1 Tax=Anthostomella pinea TaxID=933095 RepID=A0AAI8VGV6_9PEZI|nr:Uu.00g115890.m01.CDS01 [Anthostomella pinea]
MCLPPELRQLVYLALLSEPTSIRHIVFDEHTRTLRSQVCLGVTAPDTDYVGTHLQLEDVRLSPFRKGHIPCQVGGPNRNGLLGALLCCRRVYEEFSPLLYSETTFMFHELRTLRYFVDTIPRGMLPEVSKLLRLNWQLPYIDYAIVSPKGVSSALAEWTQTWTGLAKVLSNLNSVRVTILVGDRPLSLATKTRLLRSLERLRLVDVIVELVLPLQRFRYGGYWPYWSTPEGLQFKVEYVHECEGLFDFPGAQLPMAAAD